MNKNCHKLWPTIQEQLLRSLHLSSSLPLCLLFSSAFIKSPIDLQSSSSAIKTKSNWGFYGRYFICGQKQTIQNGISSVLLIVRMSVLKHLSILKYICVLKIESVDGKFSCMSLSIPSSLSNEIADMLMFRQKDSEINKEKKENTKHGQL